VPETVPIVIAVIWIGASMEDRLKGDWLDVICMDGRVTFEME
jgi:hypothetical protein